MTYTKATILNFTIMLLYIFLTTFTVLKNFSLIAIVPFLILLIECTSLFREEEISAHFLTLNLFFILVPHIISFVL